MKTKKNEITVIIPVHELNDETKQLFGKSVQSIIDQTETPQAVIVVAPKGSDTYKFLKAFDYSTISKSVTVVENGGETDFASQINYGVSVTKTEWFSILEYDDEYANIWFKNVVEYINAYEDVEIFLPIIVDTDKDGVFNGFTNEAVWAHGFCDELGMLDNGALHNYQNFNTDGMVMKKSVYEEMGGFKPSIKLTFIYEFLLRMTYKDVKTMILPKFGYRHTNLREGSLFNELFNSIDALETKWWFGLARKEYFFVQDRKITYEIEN